MADFCQQCSIELLGLDGRDLAGLYYPPARWVVICEGCGPIFVDPDGKCKGDSEGHCYENHAGHINCDLCRPEDGGFEATEL